MRVSERPSRARAETGETSKKPKPKTKPHKKGTSEQLLLRSEQKLIVRGRTTGLAVGRGRHRPNRIGFAVEVRMDLKPFKAFLEPRHRSVWFLF